jgi:Zn-dependent M28 family amino/carboxypeptidase
MVGKRLAPRLRATAALILTAAIVAGVLVSTWTVKATTAPQASPAAFGQQLFLLSPAADQLGALAGLPATVHAVIYGEAADRYVASGDETTVARAAELGLPVEVLDAHTAGKAYYFVDSQAENARTLAEKFGVILYADATQYLLALPIANEAPLLDALPNQGVSVALLPPYAISVTAAPLTAAAAAAAPQAADATVADLLNQVRSADISRYIADLSGEQAVDIGGATATLLTRYTFSTAITNSERYLYQRYAQLGIPVSYAAWTYGSYSGRNVIAELRGSLHPERIWLVGGHFDDTSESPYSRAPGADDNGSGSAATLVLAAILKDQRFSDTIRFVHFSGEEQGHWGSIIYARSLAAAGAQVMGYIDLDMIGYDGDGDRTVEIHSGTRANSVSFGNQFSSANLRYAQGLRVEVKQGSASRFSDHSSFWDQGYASFLTIENFFDDAIARDRNPWYHNTGDLSSRVNLDYVVRTARVSLAMLAEDAGLIDPNVTVTPSVTPTSTATPGPVTCTELAANGGFEGRTAWIFASTANKAAYSTAQAHSGTRSVRLGVAPAGASGEADRTQVDPAAAGGSNLLGEMAVDGASYSTAYQTITIPASANRITLTFWRRSGTNATGGDFQRMMLLRPGTYAVIATVFKSLTNAVDWQPVSYDLTPYRGQSIVIYFEVYNDDILSAPQTWMYVDDVSPRRRAAEPRPPRPPHRPPRRPCPSC